MEPPRRVRALIVLLAGAFFVFGPVYTQVLLRPARSGAEPWKPMAWHMYHSVGADTCQGDFWAVRDGQRAEYTRRELERVLPRIRLAGKYNVGRQVRKRDVVWSTSLKLDDITRAICEHERSHGPPEVHVYARCSPPYPGGRWQVVQDGEKNLCP